MQGQRSSQLLLREGWATLLASAVPMLVQAVIVALFVILETALLGLIGWSVEQESADIQGRLRPLLAELKFFSGLGAALYYALYFLGEITHRLQSARHFLRILLRWLAGRLGVA